MKYNRDQDPSHLIKKEHANVQRIISDVYYYLKMRDHMVDSYSTSKIVKVNNNLLDYIRSYIRNIICDIRNIDNEIKIETYDRAYFHMMHRFLIDSSIPDKYYTKELDPRLKLYFIYKDLVSSDDICKLKNMMNKSLDYSAQHYYYT